MDNVKENTTPVEEIISKTNEEIEQEKERNFVNLLIEIIVSITLKEFYEKGNQVSTL
ncbi:MAG: hypothetical protein QM610_10395 [Chitinophagaceae bacterium]